VSATGVLVYRDAPSLQLTWLDREGRVVNRIPEPGLYHSVALSADGTRALAARASSQVTSASELVLFDFVRNTQARIGGGAVDNGVLSPDGTRYIFEMGGAFYQGDVDGSSPPVLLRPRESAQRSLTSWSSDGHYVMYTVNHSATGSDVWAISLQGQPAAKPFLDSKAAENQGQLALVRGQLWVAYTSDELGRDEVFLRRFPREPLARRCRGAVGTARSVARMAAIFYISADGTIMVTAFQNSIAGPPVPLFKAPAGFASRDATGVRAPAPWGVTPDGQRFLFAAPTEATSPSRFTVVLNWTPSLVQQRSGGRLGS
jgi:hypothetical protein